MNRTAVIEVKLSDAGVASVTLDGKETHSETIHSEEEFVGFLGIVFDEYSWWVGEAWRLQLDEIEHVGWEEEDDEGEDAA